MIRWSDEGPTEAVHILDIAMTRIGSDNPKRVAEYVDRRLDTELLEWARSGQRSAELEALFIAWSMMRFHTLADAARQEALGVGVEILEEVEDAIRRIREAGRHTQDWGLAWQQLAVEIDSLLGGPW